ncbi:MAG: WG repeat-containing protein [Bacteroidota bacterium]
MPAAIAQTGINDCADELFLRQDKKTRLFGYVTFMNEWKVPAVFIKARPFQGKHAVVLIGKKYGLIDCEGHTVIEGQYDAMGPFVFGRGWAKKGDYWGLIDAKNRPMTSFEFTEAREVSARGALTWLKKGERWGLFNKDRQKPVTEPIFDAFLQVSDSAAIIRRENRFGILAVQSGEILLDSCTSVFEMDKRHFRFQKKGKWGMVHSRGGILQPAVWDSVGYNNGMAIIGKRGKLGICSMTGKVVADPYLDSIGAFSEGKAAILKAGKMAYISNTGRELTAFDFQNAGPVLHNLAVVSKQAKFGLLNLSNRLFEIAPAYKNLIRIPGTDYLFAKTEKGYQQTDTKGKTLFTEPADTLFIADSLNFIRYRTKTSTFYYNAVTAKYIFPVGYSEAGVFNKGLAIVKNGSGRGVINLQGETMVPLEWDSVEVLYAGSQILYRVKKGGSTGLLAKGGRVIVPAEYEALAPAGERIKVRKGVRWGLLNSNGELVLKPEYDGMSSSLDAPGWPEFPAVINTKKGYGLLSDNGTLIVKPLSASMAFVGMGLWKFQTGNLFGLMNGQGIIIIEPKYEDITDFAEGLAGFKSGGKWGFINANGIIITQPRFDEVGPFVGRVAYVKEKGKWGAWEKGGKYLLAPEYDSWEKLPGGGRRLVKLNSQK